MTERQSLFEKLDKGINTNLEENELNLLIDSLRLRLGASGKDRVNVLNFFFKRFFNLFLPPYIRYLLWVSLLGIFRKYSLLFFKQKKR